MREKEMETTMPEPAQPPKFIVEIQETEESEEFDKLIDNLSKQPGRQSFNEIESQLYNLLGETKPQKITPESFKSFFLNKRKDGNYDQYHPMDAPLPQEIIKSFGS